MKLVWCPDMASKAYIDAVKALSTINIPYVETEVAELVAAMAGGWRSCCVVEAWGPKGDGATTSLALSAAVRRTGARHVIVVPDQKAKSEYLSEIGNGKSSTAEIVVGEAEEAMGRIEGLDLVVVDLRRRDAARIVAAARLGERGAVLICKAAGHRGGGGERWREVLGEGKRVVRSVFLPIGRGVEIVHVGVGDGPSLGDQSRWIKHVDRLTGEEHVFRR